MTRSERLWHILELIEALDPELKDPHVNQAFRHLADAFVRAQFAEREHPRLTDLTEY